ncbi:MAG: hypothetical protein Q9181_001635 [Wetmoreana brouardii]
MAEGAATDISSNTPSLFTSTTQSTPTPSSPTRKTRGTDFLKPDSPRKRRRPGEESSPILAKNLSSATTPALTSPKFSVSPPTLTAAQALIDQRKQKQVQENHSNRQTSPNPAIAALSALQGKPMVSDKNSENASNAGNEIRETMATAVLPNQRPEGPHIGVAQMQNNLTPSSSFGPVEGTSAVTAMEGSGVSVASPGRMDETMGNDEEVSRHPDVHRPRRQETDPGEGRSDKALSYPGPLPNIQQADRRRNTHSGFGRDSESKSPSSTKKHQCGDDPEQDDAMAGLMYTGEASHEPEKIGDDTEAEGSRKGSLPSIKRHEAPNYSPTDGQTPYAARQPSTYPPLVGRQPTNPGGLYPPIASPGAGSSTSNSPRQASFSQNPSSSAFQAPSQNVFAQGGGMTESPKPLSPGSHQLGHPPEQVIHPNRSPSLTQQMQQQQYGRRTSMQNASPSMSLPPMPSSAHSGAPHLPSLPGLPPPDLRFTLHSQAGAPPHVHPTAQGSGPSASSPGYSQSGNNSLSSQSGEGNQLPYGQGSDRLWAYIRSLEVKIDRLQEEVATLKSQASAPR